jgi:hypothetical protein
MEEQAKIFWEWFEKNHYAYLFIHQVDDDERVRLLDNFTEQLHEYCEFVWFEMGGEPNDIYDLTFTAEGNSEYFLEVTTLIELAPSMMDWKFIAFKQPYYDDFTIQVDDISLRKMDIWFMPMDNEENSRELGICVYTPVYETFKDHEWYPILVYKLLDTILGEIGFALGISFVAYAHLPEDPEDEELLPIQELPSYVKWFHTQFKDSLGSL